MPLLKELKQEAKLARARPKCNPGASKKTILEEAPYTQKGAGPISQLPRLGTVCWDGGSAPIFGPCYNNNIVLAISNLSENPE